MGCSKDEEVSSDTVPNAAFSLISPEDGAEDLHPGFEFKWTTSETAETYRLHVRDITDEDNPILIDEWNIKTSSNVVSIQEKLVDAFAFQLLADDGRLSE